MGRADNSGIMLLLIYSFTFTSAFMQWM